MITMTTPQNEGEGDFTQHGLKYNMTYTVLNIVSLPDETVLVQCYNPWGYDTYNGPWRSDDPRWTRQYRAIAGYDYQQNDGVFFMPIEEFRNTFESVIVSLDTRNMFNDKWLMLDDHTDNPGNVNEEYTRHEFYLTS